MTSLDGRLRRCRPCRRRGRGRNGGEDRNTFKVAAQTVEKTVDGQVPPPGGAIPGRRGKGCRRTSGQRSASGNAPGQRGVGGKAASRRAATWATRSQNVCSSLSHMRRIFIHGFPGDELAVAEKLPPGGWDLMPMRGCPGKLTLHSPAVAGSRYV
jgi:hypothetical protein